jgi:hypothetical protein
MLGSPVGDRLNAAMGNAVSQGKKQRLSMSRSRRQRRRKANGTKKMD